MLAREIVMIEAENCEIQKTVIKRRKNQERSKTLCRGRVQCTRLWHTPRNHLKGRHRPKVFAVRVNFPAQDSLQLASTLPSGSKKHQAGLFAHTHTINRIYNLWIPLTVWTHNSNSNNYFPTDTFLHFIFSLIQKHHAKQQFSFHQVQSPFLILHVQKRGGVGSEQHIERDRPSFLQDFGSVLSPSH